MDISDDCVRYLCYFIYPYHVKAMRCTHKRINKILENIFEKSSYNVVELRDEYSCYEAYIEYTYLGVYRRLISFTSKMQKPITYTINRYIERKSMYILELCTAKKSIYIYSFYEGLAKFIIQFNYRSSPVVDRRYMINEISVFSHEECPVYDLIQAYSAWDDGRYEDFVIHPAICSDIVKEATLNKMSISRFMRTNRIIELLMEIG